MHRAAWIYQFPGIPDEKTNLNFEDAEASCEVPTKNTSILTEKWVDMTFPNRRLQPVAVTFELHR